MLLEAHWWTSPLRHAHANEGSWTDSSKNRRYRVAQPCRRTHVMLSLPSWVECFIVCIQVKQVLLLVSEMLWPLCCEQTILLKF